MHRGSRQTTLGRRLAWALTGPFLAVGLLGRAAVPVSAVVLDTTTITATLGPGAVSDGDAGGSGSVALTVDKTGGQACFVIAVTLTDLAGDPPTVIDVHDTATGFPGDVVLALATSVDGTGAATGCVAVSPTVADELLGHPDQYMALVTTAGFPDGAVAGNFAWSYPTTILGVITAICPSSIQSAAQLTPEAQATCLDVVLPADDLSPGFPAGYTITGYGGTQVFDYTVDDGKNVQATITSAERGGGGTCNPTSMTCSYGPLPYEWNPVGAGSTTITPTVVPTGFRVGAAGALDVSSGTTHSIPISIGLGNVVTVDTTATEAVDVTVFLFTGNAPTDTTKPTIGTPTFRFFAGGSASSSLPIRVTWSGSDTGTGIDHYVLQRSRDGGTWTTLGGILHTADLVTSVAQGHTYRYRVRAYDGAGNASGWAYSATEKPSVIQDTSSTIVYSGHWVTHHWLPALGGTLRSATAAGSKATFRFSGRNVAWVAPAGATRGNAKVYIDGHLKATLDLSTISASRLVVASAWWSSIGTHTITIKVVGTTGRPRIDVDAFLVFR